PPLSQVPFSAQKVGRTGGLGYRKIWFLSAVTAHAAVAAVAPPVPDTPLQVTLRDFTDRCTLHRTARKPLRCARHAGTGTRGPPATARPVNSRDGGSFWSDCARRPATSVL